VRLSALRAGSPLPQGDCWYPRGKGIISTRDGGEWSAVLAVLLPEKQPRYLLGTLMGGAKVNYLMQGIALALPLP
jgi:hypothetical protein